jgi:hypothetical protein
MKKILFELRMYFFVPYNLSPIQQAIQAGHAALEYARKYGHTDLFGDFIDNWKTWIVLDGGTTNNIRGANDVNYGTLDQIEDMLNIVGISCARFNEPDLNDALTAVCFIVDERVFNKKDYPDFVDYLNQQTNPFNDPIAYIKLKNIDVEILKTIFSYEKYYNDWLELIGGKKNEFLRGLLKDKKPA